jgi:3-dehydro-L-gulonate 2-dehydrogenase
MRSNINMLRILIADLTAAIEQALISLGLTEPRAALSARLIAETDRDGVHTHGIARLPRFAEMIRNGAIDPLATPTTTTTFGALERWDGHRGPGNLAAHSAMSRAMELAKTHGLGAVALGNTSHWQRGGTYGWQAAEQGLAAMCWTNTLPNLPPWDATTPALGNNPLILAIPNANAPIVLDIAMSQFSYGTLASYRERGQQLPVPGGYDESGNLTTDPATIERTQRALPIGFWKGSGLSFALDVLAAMLSGGRATHQLTTDPVQETGLSQIFLAISPTSLGTIEELTAIATGATEFLQAATPIDPSNPPRYPGEATLRTRAESLRLGVPVDESQWQKVLTLGA